MNTEYLNQEVKYLFDDSMEIDMTSSTSIFNAMLRLKNPGLLFMITPQELRTSEMITFCMMKCDENFFKLLTREDKTKEVVFFGLMNIFEALNYFDAEDLSLIADDIDAINAICQLSDFRLINKMIELKLINGETLIKLSEVCPDIRWLKIKDKNYQTPKLVMNCLYTHPEDIVEVRSDLLIFDTIKKIASNGHPDILFNATINEFIKRTTSKDTFIRGILDEYSPSFIANDQYLPKNIRLNAIHDIISLYEGTMNTCIMGIGIDDILDSFEFVLDNPHLHIPFYTKVGFKNRLKYIIKRFIQKVRGN